MKAILLNLVLFFSFAGFLRSQSTTEQFFNTSPLKSDLKAVSKVDTVFDLWKSSFIFPARLVRMKDGDSGIIEIEVPIFEDSEFDFETIEIEFRGKGFDTFERSHKKGKAAKKNATKLLTDNIFWIQLFYKHRSRSWHYKGNQRWVGIIWFADGTTLKIHQKKGKFTTGKYEDL